MAKRHHNPRLVKIHHNYAVNEIAALLGIHRNTVDRWIKKEDLPLIDARRPRLVLGRDLATFLEVRRRRNKQSCKPGEIYCVRCRMPREPAGAMAEYQAHAGDLGNLVGMCPTCEGLIYRRVNITKIASVRGDLDITFTDGQRHISECAQLSVNSDFKSVD